MHRSGVPRISARRGVSCHMHDDGLPRDLVKNERVLLPYGLSTIQVIESIL